MGLVPSNREKLQAEIEKLKSLKGKKLREYIWEYYKIPLIGFIIVLVLIGSGIYSSLVNPTQTIVMNVAWTYGPQRLEFFESLGAELTDGIVPYSKNEIVDVVSLFTTGEAQLDMGNQARFVAMMMTAELDIIISTEEEIRDLASSAVLLEISSWLPQGTEGLLVTEGEDGVTGVYGVSVINSQILEDASFFLIEEDLTPYLGVFMNTNREEKVRQAIEMFLN